jgi:4-hydroxy-3-methylbut-2-enyl diphosphate reductase
MKIIRARAMGMCFGVKDALEKVMGLESPEETAVYGQLVHNEEILGKLGKKGFLQLDEDSRSPAGSRPRLVITAHGVSDKEKKGLLEKGKALIDTTCPLVKRVHDMAKHLQSCGYFVVVVGRKDHVEVKGLVGDLTQFTVVGDPEEVRRYEADRIAILCQTTTPPSLLEAVFEKIARKNFGKEIRFVDTICRPTRERQEAVEELLDQVEALVVVGGRHSNNTRQLAARAEAKGVPCLSVERASDLAPEWFEPFEKVGLTAGTSTLDETIEEVHQTLIKMGAFHGRTIRK